MEEAVLDPKEGEGLAFGSPGGRRGRPGKTYFVTWPSFISIELICDLRSGSRVAAV